MDSVEKGDPSWGKVPKLGASSSSPSTHARMSGQKSSPPTEVPKASSSQSRSRSAAKAKGSSGRVIEQSLAIMPITVWNPPVQSVKAPSSRSE